VDLLVSSLNHGLNLWIAIETSNLEDVRGERNYMCRGEIR
jgi:hypothetical protein